MEVIEIRFETPHRDLLLSIIRSFHQHGYEAHFNTKKATFEIEYEEGSRRKLAKLITSIIKKAVANHIAGTSEI